MKILFTLLTTVAIIASCTIKTNITFKEDFSGSLEYVFDMSEMYGMLGDTVNATSLLDEEGEMQASLDEMEAKEGISNVKLREELDKGIYYLSLDFADIEALNVILHDENPMTDGLGVIDEDAGSSAIGGLQFNQKGNKIFVEMPDFQAFQESMNGEDEETQESMEMMKMMGFDYELNISFHKEVNKIKTKGNATASGNTVKFHMSLQELLELENYDQDIKIIL